MNTAELKNILKLRIDFINDKKFLSALNTLIESKTENIIVLTKEQKEMLQMSEGDIENGRLISQEAMVKRNLEWLNEL